MMEKSKENGRTVIPDLQRKNYICDKERLTEIFFLGNEIQENDTK